MASSVKYMGDGIRRAFKIGFAWGVISDIGVRLIRNGVETELGATQYRVVSDCVVYDLGVGEELFIYLKSPVARACAMQEERVQAAELAGLSAERALWEAQGAAVLAEEQAQAARLALEALPDEVAAATEALENAEAKGVQALRAEADGLCASARAYAEAAFEKAARRLALPEIVQSVEAIDRSQPGFYLVLPDCPGHARLSSLTPVELVNGVWQPCDHHHAQPEEWEPGSGPFFGTLYHVCKNGRLDRVEIETGASQVFHNEKSLAEWLDEIAAGFEAQAERDAAQDSELESQDTRLAALESQAEEFDQRITDAALANAGGAEFQQKLLGLESLVAGGLCVNTRELIAESGAWTAKATGWHRVLCIGGGGGGAANGYIIIGGSSGEFKSDYVYLEEGQEVEATIGAAGGAVSATQLPNADNRASFLNAIGGDTSFGEYVTARGGTPNGLWMEPGTMFFAPSMADRNAAGSAQTQFTIVDGGGFGIHLNPWYGRGGYALFNVSDTPQNTFVPGGNGAIIIEYNTPQKAQEE